MLAAAAAGGVQPLPEQFRPKMARLSARQNCHLDRLAVVELQLCLQYLDTTSKLRAARCSHRLLHAADHPFAWRAPPVPVSTFQRLHLGSLIRHSLLRHAPIALTLNSDHPAAEVAAIPRLPELIIPHGDSATSNIVLRLLAPPLLHGLQMLRLSCRLPLSTLQLLPTLPALHTLQCWVPEDSEDWSWLPAMPALTDLDYTGRTFRPLPQSLLGAIGRCALLRSLRLRDPRFEAGSFARFCTTPAMRQLRYLELKKCVRIEWQKTADTMQSDECDSPFIALVQLESLHLKEVARLDRLLPHLAHAPALRTLTIPCGVEDLRTVASEGATHPSRDALRQLLTAAPQLEVRLEVAATIEKWRKCFWYSGTTVSQRKQMDDQWSELQLAAAEMERVTIVDTA